MHGLSENACIVRKLDVKDNVIDTSVKKTLTTPVTQSHLRWRSRYIFSSNLLDSFKQQFLSRSAIGYCEQCHWNYRGPISWQHPFSILCQRVHIPEQQIPKQSPHGNEITALQPNEYLYWSVLENFLGLEKERPRLICRPSWIIICDQFWYS